MTLRLQISAPGEAPRDVPLLPGRNTIAVAPGEQYRLLGDAGEIPPTVRVLRVGNSMRVTGLPDGQELELGNFFGVCGPDSTCTLAISVTGSAELVVGNETVPLAALGDGSFVLLGGTEEAVAGGAAAAAPGIAAETGPGMSKGAMALLGLLGIGAAAAAGGGGGGGGGGSGAAATGTEGPANATAVLGTTETAPATGAGTASPLPAPAPTPVPAPVLGTPPVATPAPPPPPPADTTRPTLTITDDRTGVANGPVTFTFAFSEPVAGFTSADVSVSGGTAGPLSASPDGQRWTMAVTPTAGVQSGTITVDVGGGAATDAAGNPNVVATRATQAYDTRGPVATVTDDTPAATTSQPVRFRFAFDEPVVGFTAADVVVGGGTAADFELAGDARSASLVVTPPAGAQDGTITVDVPAGAVTDALGNPGVAATRATQAYDTAAPTQGVLAFTALDNQAPQTGFLPPGTATNDRTPTLSLALDALLGAGETLVLTRDGTPIASTTAGAFLTVTDSELPDGPHGYGANIVDAAGNGSVLDLNGPSPGTDFLLLVG
ncbi:MAG: hypothetical protein EHM87_19670 [Burkholderiales bacterium]|nr:MAG: hypothetical protein EHM87_19670 [Burkholderiales bacterium]